MKTARPDRAAAFAPVAAGLPETGVHEPGARLSADAPGGALPDGLQRWRDLVALAGDIAFETDAEGRFVFVAPDRPLGWPAEQLLGRPAAELLAAWGRAGADPFRATVPLRGRRVWLRHVDGHDVCLCFRAMPLLDAGGARVGARGIGQEVTRQDTAEEDAAGPPMAAALRRGRLLEFMLSRVREEATGPRMIHAVLQALAGGLDAEGAAVVGLPGQAPAPLVLHHAGGEPTGLPGLALDLLRRGGEAVSGHGHAPDGRELLVGSCQTRFGERAGLMLWRPRGARAWDEDDGAMVRAAASLVRVVLEHDGMQHEMARQARADALTALLNRRALLDEMARRVDRLDREGAPATLMLIDLDNFKQLNDSRGPEVGDEALCIVAHLLRAAVRPTDLVARLGGDEFAIWMDGCDELAAAERAELLREEAPLLLGHLLEPGGALLGVSIGIATRWPGRGETLEALMERADRVMCEVKRNGRGHWRVSRTQTG